MAQRRMFSKSITNSSKFLSMPHTSQMLYFHLGMNADDEGYVESLMILRMSNCNEQDVRVLGVNNLIKILDEGIIVVLDWKENNWIRPDRIQESHIRLKLNSAERPLPLMPPSPSSTERRKKAYEESSLPYSFSYKMRQEHVGKSCGICGHLMGPSTGGRYDLNMPSIDHILPLSQGGKHEIDNIRVVHLKCNNSRRNNASDMVGRQTSDKCQPEARLGEDRLGQDSTRESNAQFETPSEVAEDFFNKGKHYGILLEIFSKNKDAESVRREFEKFILYWTEPNKSGTKVRWQQQPTFEIKRRLFTWLNRAVERQTSKGKALVY